MHAWIMASDKEASNYVKRRTREEDPSCTWDTGVTRDFFCTSLERRCWVVKLEEMNVIGTQGFLLPKYV